MRKLLKPLPILAGAAILVVGLAAGVSAQAPQAQLAWASFTSAGTLGISSTNYGVRLSFAQPAIGPAGSTTFQVVLGIWHEVGGSGVGITELPGGELPATFSLAQNYPNPFNPMTKIAFELPRATHARLEIYNIVGRKVVTLVDETCSAGSYVADWDGRDDNGHAVASGFYLYRLETENHVATRKMILLK